MLNQVTSSASLTLQNIEDPRTPLGKMRRRELYRFADHYNIPYDRDAPAQTMMKLIRERGFSGAEPVPERSGYEVMSMPELRAEASKLGFPQGPETTREDLVAMLEGKPPGKLPTEIVESPEAPGYEAMKMPQLRKLVKARGLKQTVKTKRTELIALLEADDIEKRTSSFVPGPTIVADTI